MIKLHLYICAITAKQMTKFMYYNKWEMIWEIIIIFQKYLFGNFLVRLPHRENKIKFLL